MSQKYLKTQKGVKIWRTGKKLKSPNTQNQKPKDPNHPRYGLDLVFCIKQNEKQHPCVIFLRNNNKWKYCIPCFAFPTLSLDFLCIIALNVKYLGLNNEALKLCPRNHMETQLKFCLSYWGNRFYQFTRNKNTFQSQGASIVL